MEYYGYVVLLGIILDFQVSVSSHIGLAKIYKTLSVAV